MTSGHQNRTSRDYPFPLPLDCNDLFKVGPKYTVRWFKKGGIPVPGGTWAWVDNNIFRSYVAQLCAFLKLGGHGDVSITANKGSYEMNGLHKRQLPVRVAIPTCEPVTLSMAMMALEKRIKGNEMEVVRWVEFFQAEVPNEVKNLLRKHKKLGDIMR